ncbi:AAA family ATPase [Salinispira pacifica]|uniref:BioD-like N-terminal domain of phosphotransacetylase n=1 Tax=Salinispira pacifica TaxID=1307761 RepID=V5WJP4_9SPIO|nr:AAA family ATPase [Salinispira pacifica]AHC15391.1 BioD-like N-terminal domain of phosphotransacetylase [Salinispira pacifica]
MKVIYVAGFRQHAGKTMTSLGIISQLKKFIPAEKIGYIKPVGQELVQLMDGRNVDKDATIIQRFALPNIDMSAVSPVRLGSGVTKSFLEQGDQSLVTAGFETDIVTAMEKLSDKTVVIAEGTGHLGVGGIVGLSNSRVSRLIDAEIVYLAGGGLGKTLDMLEVDFTYMRCTGAKVRGVIFNKLLPEKIGQMERLITPEYLTKRFGSPENTISIFGFLPSVDRLGKPSMEQLSQYFSVYEAAGDKDSEFWHVPSAGVSIISQSHENLLPSESIDPGDIVILSSMSRRRLRLILEDNARRPAEKRIAGLVLTSTKPAARLEDSMDMVRQYGVPALYVPDDTHSADEKVYKCIQNTKLQPYDEEKNSQIVDLFEKHFYTEAFLKAWNL